MKILVYENSAGLSHYSHKLCNALADYVEYKVIYLTPVNNAYLDRIDRKIEVHPILDFYQDNYKKGSFLWAMNRLFISTKNIVLRNLFIKKHRPDVLSLQYTMPIIDQFLLYFIKGRCKIVMTVHDVIPPNPSKNWSIKSLQKLYDVSDQLIVHTQSNKTLLEKTFSIPSDKVTVIHHGTEVTFPPISIENIKKDLGLLNNKLTLLFFGKIRPQKGLDVLLKAMEEVNCNLIVAGKVKYGDSFKEYDKLISEKRINCVKELGHIPEKRVNELFQACDVVVLPYKYFHSMSGVFIQALQYQKPIIATDVSGFREFCDKYDIGLICEPNDVESLKGVLQSIITNKTIYQQLKSNIHIAAKENTWEKSADYHTKVFLKAYESR